MSIYVFLSALVMCITAAPLSHLVTNLPKAPPFSFKMYSGYLPIPNSMGKELHYVFYTSQNNATTDPLVLWLNGGPGCSSMEGAFMENGPFVFSETNNSMYVNPYSWNRNASMLYIEAPAGVGYSMMGSLSNNYTDDNITASDNLQALFQWFSLFPEFTSNNFYISGESYAGVYVPVLAYFIQQSNLNTSNLFINLKGILVGNGVTEWTADNAAWPIFLYWHGLIDDSIFFPWQNLNCDMVTNLNGYCLPLYQQMLNLFTNVNYYDIYRDCIHPNYESESHHLKWKSYASLGGVLNCVPDNALVRYLNLPTVRNALHINTTLGSWNECIDLDYVYDYTRGSYYVYPSLIASGINIQQYSGDTDSAVPTGETIYWLNLLNYPVTRNWTEWTLNGQVAGFFMRYTENLRFNTIRGAGHMCILWKRPEGFHMFMTFLQGQDLA